MKKAIWNEAEYTPANYEYWQRMLKNAEAIGTTVMKSHFVSYKTESERQLLVGERYDIDGKSYVFAGVDYEEGAFIFAVNPFWCEFYRVAQLYLRYYYLILWRISDLGFSVSIPENAAIRLRDIRLRKRPEMKVDLCNQACYTPENYEYWQRQLRNAEAIGATRAALLWRQLMLCYEIQRWIDASEAQDR